MSNINSTTIRFDSGMTVEQFAEKLQEMRAAVMYDGRTVINNKVTDKVIACQTRDSMEIFRAGVSGMTIKDGVLVNKPGLFFSNNYGGKMYQIAGLSGFAGNNRRCIQRATSNYGVCPECFSFIGSKFSNLNAWTKNDTIISTVKFMPGDIIFDPEKIHEMRYSTHGDLINGLHAYNLCIMAADNPQVQFTLWTKNHSEWSTGLAIYHAEFGEKPENLRVIFSAYGLDQMFSDYQLRALKNNGYNAIFAVYTTQAAQDKAVSMGAYRCVCGKSSCKDRCHFCYDYYTEWAGNESDKAVWIAEIIDGEKHKE